MFLVAYWDADNNDDKIVPCKYRHSAEAYYKDLVSKGYPWVFLCKVLKEHDKDKQEQEAEQGDA